MSSEIKKKIEQMSLDHSERLSKMDWSDPNTFLKEVQYAKELTKKQEALVESLPEQSKVRQ